MNCYLCGSARYMEILNKQDIRIWLGLSDGEMSEKRMYKCAINQCSDCGHVYQPLDDGIKNILHNIYFSSNAPGASPMGKGNWGLERARDFLDKLHLENYKSAVEIGCADGYVLKCLKDMGYKKLVGIDPSINKTGEIEGILFVKGLIDEKLTLSQKYDLIFSNAVLEHIEKINEVIKFCKNNLNENGEVFFSVPNAQRELETGGPGLFVHQHLHYFTESSLTYLLSKNDFQTKSVVTTNDSLNVSAKIRKSSSMEEIPEIVFYGDYQKKLEKILNKIETILQSSNIAIHGANSALNNILGWLGRDFDFVLIDNDNNKQDKRYFDRIVKSMGDIELNDYDTLLIIPSSYYETIKTEYLNRGFNGKIESVLLEKA